MATNTENEENVIAYRLGRVEKLVDLGFNEVHAKLDAMAANFATKQELKETKDAAHKEHQNIRHDIAEVKQDVDGVMKWKEAIVNKIALAAVMALVMMLLAVYGLDRLIK